MVLRVIFVPFWIIHWYYLDVDQVCVHICVELARQTTYLGVHSSCWRASCYLIQDWQYLIQRKVKAVQTEDTWPSRNPTNMELTISTLRHVTSFYMVVRAVKLDLFRWWNVASCAAAHVSGRFSVSQSETCPLLQLWVVLGGASPWRWEWSSGPLVVMGSSELPSCSNHCRQESDKSLEQPLAHLRSALESSWTHGQCVDFLTFTFSPQLTSEAGNEPTSTAFSVAVSQR